MLKNPLDDAWLLNAGDHRDKLTMTYRRHVTDPMVFQMQTIEVDGVVLSLDNPG